MKYFLLTCCCLLVLCSQAQSVKTLGDNGNATVLFSPPLKHLQITSPYGMRFHPILKKRCFHSGIDLRASHDTVFAILSGTVLKASSDNGYGNYIKIAHGKGYVSTSAHLSKIFVKQGDKVKAGQALAITGNTGLSSGEHLHFGVSKYGQPINPLPFLAELAYYNNLLIEKQIIQIFKTVKYVKF